MYVPEASLKFASFDVAGAIEPSTGGKFLSAATQLAHAASNSASGITAAQRRSLAIGALEGPAGLGACTL